LQSSQCVRNPYEISDEAVIAETETIYTENVKNLYKNLIHLKGKAEVTKLQKQLHFRPERSDAEFCQVSPAASVAHLVIQF